MAAARVRHSPTLKAAVDRSVKANSAIDHEVDAALIAGARLIAGQIDDVKAAYDKGDVDLMAYTKAMYLMPHLQSHLKEMLATPASRQAAKLKDAPKGKSKLEGMRGGGTKPGTLRSV